MAVEKNLRGLNTQIKYCKECSKAIHVHLPTDYHRMQYGECIDLECETRHNCEGA